MYLLEAMKTAPALNWMAAFVSFRNRKIFLIQGKKEAFSESKTLCQVLRQASWGVLNDLERPRRIGKPSRWWGPRGESTSLQLPALAPTLPCQASTPCATACHLRGCSILFSSPALRSKHLWQSRFNTPVLITSLSAGERSKPELSPGSGNTGY